MAIRRPSLYRQSEWIYQDFFLFESGPEELRYAVIKYDGEAFELYKQTFDDSDPILTGGPIVARIDYTLVGQAVTIDSWEINWRDEWPLRLLVEWLTHCVYRRSLGYTVAVDKDAYAFWVSEVFVPTTNSPLDILIHAN
jgi:hypothetical protein